MIGRLRLISAATVLVACLILLTAFWVERMNDLHHVADNRAAAFADLALMGSRIETALLSDVHMVHGLAGLIAANPQIGQDDFARAARQQMGRLTLRGDAVRLATEGRTTIEEAMRVATQFDE